MNKPLMHSENQHIKWYENTAESYENNVELYDNNADDNRQRRRRVADHCAFSM